MRPAGIYRSLAGVKLALLPDFTYLYRKFMTPMITPNHIMQSAQARNRSRLHVLLRPWKVALSLLEGCYKLHETAWLEQYPQHTPTDIFEGAFKNTGAPTTKTSIICRWKRGDIVLLEASPDTTSASSPDGTTW